MTVSIKSILFSIIITMLLLMQSQAQTCGQCYNVLKYGCKQCKSYCQSSIYELFSTCNQNRCPKDKLQQCLIYEKQIKNMTQQICVQQCCSDGGSGGEGVSNNNLNECLNTQKLPNYTVAAFIGIIGGVLILTIVGGIIYYKWKQKTLPCMHNNNENENENEQPHIQLFVQQHQPLRKYSDQNTLSNLSLQSNHIKWSNLQQNNINTNINNININNNINNNKQHIDRYNSNIHIDRNQTTVCSICIQPSINTLTQCGHWFHLLCIYQWYIRNCNCPLCKHQISPPIVSLFCIGCYKKYVKIALHRHVNISYVLNAIKDSKCQNCMSYQKQEEGNKTNQIIL